MKPFATVDEVIQVFFLIPLKVRRALSLIGLTRQEMSHSRVSWQTR